ncbi:MAG: helix-turn-helix domain-containing protein [Rhizobiales bacterium]|nr:helix-turn-helix domain-containing protein [Hyphomicrobiales bacterium]
MHVLQAGGDRLVTPQVEIAVQENICKALDCQPGDILEYRQDET